MDQEEAMLALLSFILGEELKDRMRAHPEVQKLMKRRRLIRKRVRTQMLSELSELHDQIKKGT